MAQQSHHLILLMFAKVKGREYLCICPSSKTSTKQTNKMQLKITVKPFLEGLRPSTFNAHTGVRLPAGAG